jgi:hypothetical protein
MKINNLNLYDFAKTLWPICRSITGEGVRETLNFIKNSLPELLIKEIPTGEKIFDWVIPKEWIIRNAWIIKPDGKKICSFKENNLHIIGYSIPFNGKMNLSDLNKHLISLPEQPNAIPYVTSYYEERWGFCISQNERDSLEEGIYEVYIDSELFNGSLTYGELYISGKSKYEIFLSTYICHPSLANNELSGPVVTTFLADWISKMTNRKYSYRIIFIPETIGSIAYLSKNLQILKNNVIAGFNITCIGDDRCYSFLPSRSGNTISDKVAKHVLKYIDSNYKSYSWLDRGSDERQYCSPGIDLPIASIMRSKYGEYPEYHTSLDNLNLITQTGLEGGLNVLKNAIKTIEINCMPVFTILCEPKLSKRNLYPTLSLKGSADSAKTILDILTFSDGNRDLIEIAELINIPAYEISEYVDQLVDLKLLKKLY